MNTHHEQDILKRNAELEKELALKNRELEIEAALEKVRSRSLAMHHSTELGEVINVVFEKLQELGFVSVATASITLSKEDSRDLISWVARPGLSPIEISSGYFECSIMSDYWNARESGVEFFQKAYSREEKNIFLGYLFEYTDFKNLLPAQLKTEALEKEDYACSCAFSKNSAIFIDNLTGKLLSEEEAEIVKRFARVFEQAYIRFLDLKQAEAQARESQIQLGLERVRARAMAMQKSGELSELVDTVFKELTKLDFALTWCIINIIDEPSLSNTVWAANPDINKAPESYHMKFEGYPFHHAMMNGWKERKVKYVYVLEGIEKKIYDEYLYNETEFRRIPEAAKVASKAMEKYVVSFSFSNFGGLQTVGDAPLSDANLDILSRFGKVFDLTYTRFNDLKQAEAQAREAQIEAGLERVRSRSMAMHNTSELQEVIHTVHKELLNLNIAIHGGSFIAINRDIDTELRCWGSGGTANTSEEVRLPFYEKPFCTNLISRIKSAPGFFTEEYTQTEKKDFFTFLLKYEPWSKLDAKQKKEILSSPGGYTRSCCVSQHTSIFIINHFGEKFSAADNDILQRFGKVFEQTYTRFNDLKQAEAQARESQIQLALERVRARTMAMQKSDELAEAASLLFTQIADLGTNSWSSGFIIFQPDELSINSWMSKPDGSMGVPFNIPVTEDPFFIKIYEAYKRGEEFFVMESGGKELEETYRYMFGLPGAAKALGAIEDIGFQMPTFQITHCTFFHQGFLMFITYKPCPEMWDIFKRFGKVFEQTYTRFLDLQKAEAQARESQIQLALERVRARTMAMQHSDELKEAAALLFQQVKSLGAPAYSCGYNIWEENEKEFTSWMSAQDGSIINGVPNIPLTEDANFIRYVESKQNGEQFFVLELRDERMQEHYQYLKTIPAFKAYFDYAVSVGFDLPKTQIHHLANFSQGNLLFITLEPCPEFHDVFKRFAAVFEQTYTRFLDLQKSEAQARESQIQLAMERVRARTMAMQKSDELQEVVNSVYERLNELEVGMDGAAICTFIEGTKDYNVWIGDYQEPLRIKFNEFTQVQRDYNDAIERRQELFTNTYSGEIKKEYIQFLLEQTVLGINIPEEQKQLLLASAFFTTSLACTKNTVFQLYRYTVKSFSTEENDILKRFANVFEQSYTRFLDLQKAEAQARDSQIELALERVRARTMAMQKSDELREAVLVIYEQLQQLNFESKACNIIIIDKESGSAQYWVSGFSQEIFPESYTVPYFDHPYQDALLKPWKQGDKYVVYEYTGKMKQSFDEIFFTQTEFRNVPEDAKKVMIGLESVKLSTAFISYGALQALGAEPLSEENANILQRFAKVFEQTYTRFLDLQKAEAQAREAQIEAALEKVRSRSLAMHTANELGEVVTVIVEKLKDLGVVLDGNGVVLCTYFQHSKDVMHWIVSPDFSMAASYLLPYFDHPIFNDAWQSRESGVEYFSKSFSVEEKNSFFEYAFEHSDYKYFPEDFKQWIFQNDKHILSFAWQKNSAILIPSHTGVLPTESDKAILIRFAKVFEQSYVRFLDLQKSEEQARESQIQLALERVRARTMAMQKSDELPQAANLLFQQIQSLGMAAWSAGYCIWDDDKKAITLSMSSEGVLQPTLRMPLTEDPSLKHFREAHDRGEAFFVEDVGGDALKEHYTYLRTLPGVKETLDDIERAGFPVPTFQIFHLAYFTQGFLLFITYEPVPESHDIFKRFAKVFEQTYTRFLDLQKAESQVREAQIEAALEKVRSRSLAMHHSNEIKEVVKQVFEKMKELGFFQNNSVMIVLPKNGFKDILHWTFNENFETMEYYIPAFNHRASTDPYQAWKRGEKTCEIKLNKEEKDDFLDQIFTYTDYSKVPEEFKKYLYSTEAYSSFEVFENHCGLLVDTFTSFNYSQDQKDVVKRFANVFEQAYIRFLDLQKAETQARESQIQLALERVRARTMAMQKSDELPETSYLLFQQVKELGLTAVQNSIAIINDETGFVELSTTVHGHNLPHMLNVPIDDPYVMAKGVAAWKAKRRSLRLEFEGQELKDYNDHRNSFFEKKVNFPEDQWIVNIIFFSKGWLSFSSNKHISDETFDLLKRFAAVFEQTYTRFNDLKQAEEQARESQIQLALERVRARTMAMQKSDELMETAVVLFDQLNQLGENIERTIIGIMNEEERVVDVWATRPDGSQMEKMQKFPIDEPIVMQKVFAAWGQQKKSIVIDLQGEELETYFQFLKSRGPKLKREIFGERRVENFAFFSKGILGIISVDPNTPANVGLYERFAAVFDQTYTRFLDLQRSEAQAREAQIEAALERVRSRSMGMQKSEELKEVIQVVYEQFVHLNINVEHTGFVMDYKARDDYDIWIADQLGVPSHLTIPYFDCVYYNRFNEAKKKGEDFFTTHLDFEEKNRFYQKIIEYVHRLSEETKQFLFSIPGLAASTVLLENVCLYIENFSGIPFSDEENKILMRFGKVFQQTYTRFLDLQKAEAQAREAQIEASLERIRSRTMGMQKSNELKDVATLLNKELIHLGITNFASCGYIEIEEKSNRQHSWLTNPDGVSLEHFFLPLTGEHIFDERYDAWKRKDVVFKQVVHAKELKKHLDFAYSGFGSQESENIGRNFFPDPTIFYSCNFSYGYLSLITGVMLSQAEELLLARFTRVFEQTYSRFLDLQKAEAQAREAKIEAALERVRASTMAMQHSDHLSETAFVLFKQFKELGEAPERIFIATFDNEQDGIIDIWGTNQGGNQLNKLFKVSADEPTLIKKIITAWKEKKRSVVIDLKGEELEQYTSFLRSTGIPVVEGIMEERRVQTIGCFSKGVIGVTTPEPQPAESVQLLERFAGVFDLTYTRFLDLQQAEAQAREAKIEAALERVRSRTMGMQKSDELGEVSHVLNEQLQQLNFKNYIAGFLMDYKNSDDFEVWRSDPSQLLLSKTHIPYFDHPIFNAFIQSKEKGLDFNTLCLSVEEKNKWVDHVLPYFPPLPGEIKDLLYSGAGYAISCAYMKNVAVFVENFDGIPFTDEENGILKRFAKVFEQTYTRFLDLQKAEAQALESQIEAALERVRSRTMAMQHSDELKDAALLLFQQVQSFGVDQWACGYNIWEADGKTCTAWMSRQGRIQPPFKTHPAVDHCFQRFYDAKQRGESFYVDEIGGDEIKTHYKRLISLPEFKSAPKEFFDEFIAPEFQIFHIAYFEQGYLMFITYKPVPETWDIFKRFAKVFEQTYTRFLDLQKSEAQAREVIKRASVDRVRAEIASMRTTNDLERIQPLVWNELTTLDVPFTRCGVFIMDEEHDQVDTFLSTPEGKSIASFTSNYSDVAVINEALPYWRKKEIYKAHWDEATFLAQAQTLLSQGNITSAETYLTEHRPKDLYLHFLPFLQGILYVGNETPLNDDELQLVQNLADAFSIAYARYEDFNKLEAAKEQIENTLTNLKQAQAQLVQSEKMASLGELTAGIAHEIQNPLNFVNNFSEVNTELIAEMKDEIEKGNIEEVRAIANDIADNEQKINHHGKRADAIVKGMLQHSRSSSGVKEPSDINVLADEYLRLAYHGLRAKDKSFNATMKTDYDATIGKINIVPQDVGRSVLNLITNAFYAVSEKKKQIDTGYEPTVTVTTKRINGKVEIRVADNGNGIPQKVLDKIFQPFFTTKPTGEGTGLGLSLSYDIVKAHNGELKVETNVGEGSEFIIFLPANN